MWQGPAVKWKPHPNLRNRPLAPAKNRGPVQRAIRRAFAASGADVLSASAIYDWTHPRRRMRRKTMPFGIYSRTRLSCRTLAANAVRLRLHALAAVSDEHPSAPLLPKLACPEKKHLKSKL